MSHTEIHMQIAQYTITKVHRGKVRVYNENTTEAVTVREWDFAEYMDVLLSEGAVATQCT